MKTEVKIQTSTADISKSEDGIIRVAIRDNAFLEANSLVENYNAYVDIMDGDDAPFLIIVNNSATISTEGRVQYNKETRKEVRRKDALVIKNPATMLLINSQVKFCKPIIPTQAFLDESSAIAWLRQA
jgi:UDP-3-O-acyl-N-acetylglucosamine deacetylase